MEKIEKKYEERFLGINKKNYKEYVKTVDDCYMALMWIFDEIKKMTSLLYNPSVSMAQKPAIEEVIENYRNTVDMIALYQYELDSGLYYKVNLANPVVAKGDKEVRKPIPNTNMSVIEYEDVELPVYALLVDGELREIFTDVVLSDQDMCHTSYIKYTSKEKVTNREVNEYFEKIMNAGMIYAYKVLLGDKVVSPSAIRARV